MLGNPVDGWSLFQLDDTAAYDLSYLSDIPMEWLDQAIHGLETLCPFCVKCYLEPSRFLCLVSYWNCYIICEDEDKNNLSPLKASRPCEYSHTSMLQFCQFLYDDISSHIDDWAAFCTYREHSRIEEQKHLLKQKLAYLKKLVHKREKRFGPGFDFL